jgi:hypothetical protein
MNESGLLQNHLRQTLLRKLPDFCPKLKTGQTRRLIIFHRLLLLKLKEGKIKHISEITFMFHLSFQCRLTGLMAKVKEGAEKAKEELENAKREIEKRAGALDGVAGANGRKDSSG